MKSMYNVIKGPLITEKSTAQRDKANKVTFFVDIRATKNEIKEAVERIFKVKVVDVNTITMLGKKKRVQRTIGKRPDWKKAIVTLGKGERLDIFEGV